MTAPAPYIALALQTTCFAVNSAPDACASRPRMADSIARIADQIGVAATCEFDYGRHYIVLPTVAYGYGV